MTDVLALSLLGTTVQIGCNDGKIVELLLELWQPFQSELVDPDTSMSIELDEEGGEWCVTVPDRGSVSTPDAWAVLDQVSSAIFQHVVRHGVGFADIHAAVLQHDDEIVLLAGAPGDGKTTLTLELLQREGWVYMSDDLAALNLASGDVATFPKPLSVKDPDRWVEISRRWATPSWLPAPRGAFVVPADRWPFRAEGASPPTHVAFIARRPAHPSVSLVSPGEAAFRFGTLVSKKRLGSETMSALSRLCQDAQVAELVYEETSSGADLVEDWIG